MSKNDLNKTIASMFYNWHEEKLDKENGDMEWGQGKDGETGWICQICRETNHTQTHNIIYEMNWSNDFNDAWKLFNKIMTNSFFSQRKNFFDNLQSMTKKYTSNNQLVSYPDVFIILKDNMPESICKAAILTFMEKQI